MLVDEEGERASHDLIHQQTGALHGFPATSPVHRNDPPIATMQFNETSNLRRTIRLQRHHLHRRRHDLGEIVRIAMKGKHGLRAGGENGAGVEVG